MDESKRIRKLKENLIKELPFFPNDKETLNELKEKGLNDILINYLHWKTRLIPTRIRRVHLAPEVTSDKRWKSLRQGINGLLDKVRKGIDISPHLSMRAHKDGYTPLQRVKDGLADSWDDKDQLLNTKGFHHFHLSMNIQNSGLSERTDDVLFAYVSRDIFHAVGIFNHSVFDSADINGQMSAERTRMWGLHEKHVTFGMAPGTAYISHPIATSGHPLYLVRMCDYYAKIIRDNDKKLDERSFVNTIYEEGGLTAPSKFDFEWHLNGLDLGFLDKKTKTLFNLHKGHI